MSNVPVFECATHLGVFTNREEWLEVRKTGIGGSEVATICGLNPYEGAYTLWMKKTGRTPEKDLSSNEAVEWGNRLEPVVIDKFEQSHPELNIVRDVGTYAHIEREWQRANPDFLYWWIGDDEVVHYGIGEVKTAQFEDQWLDGPPKHYRAQVQWYLHTLGLGEATIIVLFHGNKYREYQILANPIEQSINLERVTTFVESLITQTPPDFDTLESTYDIVRAQNPNINPDMSEDIDYLGVQYFARESQAKREYAELQKLKTYILDAMGDAKYGTIDGEIRFVRSARGDNGTPYLTVKKGTVK